MDGRYIHLDEDKIWVACAYNQVDEGNIQVDLSFIYLDEQFIYRDIVLIRVD